MPINATWSQGCYWSRECLMANFPLPFSLSKIDEFAHFSLRFPFFHWKCPEVPQGVGWALNHLRSSTNGRAGTWWLSHIPKSINHTAQSDQISAPISPIGRFCGLRSFNRQRAELWINPQFQPLMNPCHDSPAMPGELSVPGSPLPCCPQVLHGELLRAQSPHRRGRAPGHRGALRHPHGQVPGEAAGGK